MCCRLAYTIVLGPRDDRKHLSDRIKLLLVQRIENPGRTLLRNNQTLLNQQFHMIGQGRLRNGQMFQQVTGTQFTARQHIHYFQADRIAQCFKQPGLRFIILQEICLQCRLSAVNAERLALPSFSDYSVHIDNSQYSI